MCHVRGTRSDLRHADVLRSIILEGIDIKFCLGLYFYASIDYFLLHKIYHVHSARVLQSSLESFLSLSSSKFVLVLSYISDKNLRPQNAMTYCFGARSTTISTSQVRGTRQFHEQTSQSMWEFVPKSWLLNVSDTSQGLSYLFLCFPSLVLESRQSQNLQSVIQSTSFEFAQQLDFIPSKVSGCSHPCKMEARPSSGYARGVSLWHAVLRIINKDMMLK